MSRLTGAVGAVWGASGVFALLLFAIYRLGGRALTEFAAGLTPGQWFATVVVTVLMAYMEGYRGFQLRFSPRTAARIRYLRDRPDPLRSLLAPLVAMGYLHATRRRKIGTYSLTFGIVAAVTLVRFVSPPWRGIIDAGVAVGLVWGVVTLGMSLARALTSASFDVSPEVPQP